ncbi:MAG: DUF2589 domain-containing protein [Nannocystaceae bacterium]
MDGRELSSLDFASLIGAPLNAIIEAQAKAAITTANFVREVAFDKEGRAVLSEFRYRRIGADGREEEVALSVPFITMLPIPYITVERAEIEFNAKITSSRESSLSDAFSAELGVGLDVSWFKGVNVSTKMAYQRQSSSQEKEQRSYDMRVLVQVRSADIPPGTQRLLDTLEAAAVERVTGVSGVSGVVQAIDDDRSTLQLSTLAGIGEGWKVTVAGAAFTITRVDRERGRVIVDAPVDLTIRSGDAFEARQGP